MRLFGYGKGSLSKASEKAFELWLSQVSEVLEMAESIGDPVEAIYGIAFTRLNERGWSFSTKPEKSDLGRLSNMIVLLDSNIFLEVELAEKHAEAFKRLLGMVRDGALKAAITTGFLASRSR